MSSDPRRAHWVAQGRRPSPRQAFWPGMSLDLTGATLVDLPFSSVSVLRATFDGATFQGRAEFGSAILDDGTVAASMFGGEAASVFKEARVLHLDDPDRQRSWPDGYTVRPDPADPTRGTLVWTEQVEEPEPAIPASDRPADNGLGAG